MLSDRSFSKIFTAPESECDAQRRCTLPYLLRCMEETSFADAERIGQGIDLLREKYGLGWMLFQSDLTVSNLPSAGEQFAVYTTYLGVRGVSAFRSYDILIGGDTVAHCEQVWVVVSLSTRLLTNPQKIPELMREGLPEIPRRRHNPIRIDLPLFPVGTKTVLPDDLDFNGHMNNVRYVEHALPILPDNRFSTPCQLRLSYQYELLEGQSYDCLIANKKGATVVVFRANGRNCFVLEISK